MKDELLLLSEENVRELLSPRDVIEAVEGVFMSCGRGEVIPGPIGRMPVNEDGSNFCMTFPAGLRNLNLVGMKWFCGYTHPQPGYPFSHGNMLLLADLRTGSPFALMGAGTITAMRTAGGHCVVGAKYLTKENPEVLTVIGTGTQARAGIVGFLTQFPTLRRLNIWGRTAASCEKLREEFGAAVEVSVFSDIEKAVQHTDIVLTATTSSEILVKADWIQPGTTVVTVSAFCDMDPAITARADKWVLGSYEEDTDHVIRSPALRHGYPLSPDRVWADLPELVSGKKPGREHPDEIIVCSHMGMGLFDLACGKRVYDLAVQRGVGQRFTLGSF